MSEAEQILRLVGQGHTLRAACAAVGWLPEQWERATGADPGLVERALLARGRADFRAEKALLDLVRAGGQTGAKALEEMAARRRLDLSLGSADERSALDRLLASPAALAGLSDADRDALDAALTVRRAAEAIAAGALEKISTAGLDSADEPG